MDQQALVLGSDMLKLGVASLKHSGCMFGGIVQFLSHFPTTSFRQDGLHKYIEKVKKEMLRCKKMISSRILLMDVQKERKNHLNMRKFKEEIENINLKTLQSRPKIKLTKKIPVEATRWYLQCENRLMTAQFSYPTCMWFK